MGPPEGWTMAAMIVIPNLFLAGLVLWLTIEWVVCARREAAEAVGDPVEVQR